MGQSGHFSGEAQLKREDKEAAVSPRSSTIRRGRPGRFFECVAACLPARP